MNVPLTGARSELGSILAPRLAASATEHIHLMRSQAGLTSETIEPHATCRSMFDSVQTRPGIAHILQARGKMRLHARRRVESSMPYLLRPWNLQSGAFGLRQGFRYRTWTV